MWGNVMRGLQSLWRQGKESKREWVGRQCWWVFGHPFVLTQSQLNRWVPPERSGTEGERGSVSGLKGHMTQARTTQLTGVNPDSNVHYILGYHPILPLPHKYTITLKMVLPALSSPAPHPISHIPSHHSLESLSHPALERCGWPPLNWSVRFVPCKGQPYIFGSFEVGGEREANLSETVRGWDLL